MTKQTTNPQSRFNPPPFNAVVRESIWWTILFIGMVLAFAHTAKWDFLYFLIGWTVCIETLRYICTPADKVVGLWLRRMFYAKRVGYNDYFDIVHGVFTPSAQKNYDDAFTGKWVFGRALLRWRYRAGMRKGSKVGMASALWLQGVDNNA